MISFENPGDALYLNALTRVSSLGPKRIATLLERYGSAAEAWAAPAGALKAVPALAGICELYDRERKHIDPEKELQRLQEKGISIITQACPDYPEMLRQISYPPPMLYCRGSLEKIDQPAVAIVGSRRCTFYGKEVAFRLGGELADNGIAVISGMALGVDTAAHRGCLENGGYTVAVLGCGVERCYPPRNAELMENIAAEGAVVSEFPLDTGPVAGNFPRRNRIISGLSLGTVVVEATAKSGALITAGFALEQNREVFAVPGNVGSPYSRGCHRLIKEGARLVESAADILEELYLDCKTERQLTIEQLLPDLSREEQALLEAIPYQPVHIDVIIGLHGGSPAEVMTGLLSLELKKLVGQTPGKYFCRLK